MWRDKLVIGGAIGFLAVALIALSGVLSPGQKALSPPNTTPTEIDAVSRECAAGDLAIAIEVRRPSVGQREDSGWDAVQSPHPVASLVARNVSGHRCVGALGAWDFKILDPVGKTIADWDNVGWFDVNYPPGRSRLVLASRRIHLRPTGAVHRGCAVSRRGVHHSPRPEAQRHHLHVTEVVGSNHVTPSLSSWHSMRPTGYERV